ncbi:MAG: hypothetical protein ACKPH7_10615, partial [Planktothrix sp.]|uniref:hypothetical protein n=1 Tax=Planktothrix sp. TaxID=3088171 RepID=UPI0038D3D179
NPPPTRTEIAEMLGIDLMFVENITQTLEAYNNVVINSESTITVEPATQKLFFEKNSIFHPKSTQQIYAIEDFLTGDFVFSTTPRKNAPVALKTLDELIDELNSPILDEVIDESNQLNYESHLTSEAIQAFISQDPNVFVKKINKIESKKIYEVIVLFVVKSVNGDYLIKAFLGEKEVLEVSTKLTELTTQENFNLKNVENLLSPNIPNEVITSVRESWHSGFLRRQNKRNSMEPKQVYIGLPPHLLDIVWVERKYRTNRLSHIPGGSDVVVEYHDGRALGYDWIKFPDVYIRTFFAGIIEYGLDNFTILDKNKQLQITKNKIARLYERKYKNEDERINAPFEEVWNSQTSNEMPWDSFKRFKHQKRKQYHFNFNKVSDFNPISVWDYYGYEPEYEDPIDKAERLYGIPDPRLVEN